MSHIARSELEVLAPAGDWDALRAAVASGANAVYFGLPQFNARHRATNFTLEELPALFEYLHSHHVRGYVAFNTLIFSDELPAAVEALAAAVRAGADAVIVQDLGIVQLVRRLAPELSIHGSTQMTLTEPRGIEFVRRLGVERVILARELSIAEIGKIAAATTMPLETFVHGAICVAYSGQCLTSEALGGRSANRGQCAQACRMPYELIVDGARRDLADKAYLLSPHDLAAYDLVPELLAAGVASLKIEGRLKGAPYVAATTQTYRAAADAALAGEPFSLDRQQALDLAQSYSRGFGAGFLKGNDHQQLVPARFPKSRGVYVGRLVGTTRRGVLVELAAEHPDGGFLKPGDGIVFDEGHPEEIEPGGRIYAIHARPPRRQASTPPGADQPAAPLVVELEFGRDRLDITKLAADARVWRTDDPTLRKRLESHYPREGIAIRQPLDFTVRGEIGGPLSIVAQSADGLQAEAAWPGPLEVARNHPTTEAMLAAQLERLGDTPFVLGSVTSALPPTAMVPKSVLNELRRQAVTELVAALVHRGRARAIHAGALEELRAELRFVSPAASASPQPAEMPVPAAPAWSVLVRTLAQLEAVLAWQPGNQLARPALVYCDFEDVRRYREAVPLARASSMPIALATLRIMKPGEEGLLRQIARAEPDGVLIRNLGALDIFRSEHPELFRIGDFSLNVANELTADVLLGEGLERVVPSYDLSWEQLASMLGRIDPARLEVVVHQHMPMFHMEHCVFAHCLSSGKDHRDCGRPCDHHRVDLRDHTGAAFPLIPDTGCRNTVYNAIAQSGAEYMPRMLSLGVRHFRVELLRESAASVIPLLEQYARILAGQSNGRTVWQELRVLNQLGVTRGTLQRT